MLSSGDLFRKIPEVKRLENSIVKKRVLGRLGVGINQANTIRLRRMVIGKVELLLKSLS